MVVGITANGSEEEATSKQILKNPRYTQYVDFIEHFNTLEIRLERLSLYDTSFESRHCTSSCRERSSVSGCGVVFEGGGQAMLRLYIQTNRVVCLFSIRFLLSKSTGERESDRSVMISTIFVYPTSFNVLNLLDKQKSLFFLQ